MNKKSIGISILGILFIWSGVAKFCAPIFHLAEELITKESIITGFVLGVLCLSIGIGILKLKSWGWIAAISWTVTKIVFISIGLITIDIPRINSLAYGDETRTWIIGLTLLGVRIIIGLGIVFYLTRPRVKEQFNGWNLKRKIV